jgi:hypothetical protein
MAYEYKMVQLAPVITVSSSRVKGNEAADYLKSIVEENTKNGWEFFRVDSIGVLTKPGCLASLLGAKEATLEYYVATFRK